MFRDLKEYQQIQKIYEERVCITEEERYITKELEETFTEDELNFIAENTEEVFAEINNQLIEEGSEITQETIDEMAKVVAKAAVPLAKRMAAGFSKNVAKTKPLAGSMAKKAVSLGKGLKSKAGELIKKGVGFVKKNAGKIATAVGAGAVGGAIGASTANKNKVETDSKGTSIPSTAEIRAQKQGRGGGGNAGGSTDSGGTQGKGGAPAQTTPAPEKKMSSIEKKNRARFGDKRVDMLKAKQTDFKAMRKGTMSKDDFIKKYPKSITAQKAAGLRDHTEWDAYDMVLEYLFSTEQVSSLEEANYVMMEMDQETIGSIVNEVTYYLDEGIIDNLKAGASKVGNLVKKGVDTVKSAAGGVKDKVVKRVERRQENVAINKRIKEKQSGADAGSGKTRAQVMALKRKKDKLNNPNKPQLSGADKAKAMAKARLAAKSKM